MEPSGNRQRENSRRQVSNAGSRKELQTMDLRRNPYLAEYDTQKKSTGKRSAKKRNIENRSAGKRNIEKQSAGGRISQSRSRKATARRRRVRRQKQIMLLTGCVVILLMCIWLYRTFFEKPEIDGSVAPTNTMGETLLNALGGERIQGLKASDYNSHPTWTEDFLTVNEYSRPGDALKEVNNIFVHYTANPGTSATQNRSYFEQLKDTHERSASAHFIIGYEGEILQCIPLDEIAYAVAGRNEDSISIECCYTAEDGSFTQETYDSLVALLKWLTDVYDLKTDDILRHYDCGGKKCPLYYVEHEDAWEQLKRDVGSL